MIFSLPIVSNLYKNVRFLMTFLSIGSIPQFSLWQIFKCISLVREIKSVILLEMCVWSCEILGSSPQKSLSRIHICQMPYQWKNKCFDEKSFECIRMHSNAMRSYLTIECVLNTWVRVHWMQTWKQAFGIWKVLL